MTPPLVHARSGPCLNVLCLQCSYLSVPTSVLSATSVPTILHRECIYHSHPVSLPFFPVSLPYSSVSLRYSSVSAIRLGVPTILPQCPYHSSKCTLTRPALYLIRSPDTVVLGNVHGRSRVGALGPPLTEIADNAIKVCTVDYGSHRCPIKGSDALNYCCLLEPPLPIQISSLQWKHFWTRLIMSGNCFNWLWILYCFGVCGYFFIFLIIFLAIEFCCCFCSF